jgi:hypothetical protein
LTYAFRHFAIWEKKSKYGMKTLSTDTWTTVLTDVINHAGDMKKDPLI